MKYILGSGLIGCLARKILGPEWSFIPFKRSRYYSFDYPLADDLIVFDKDIDDFMSIICNDKTQLFLKRPFSYQGQLIYQNLPMVVEPYIRKVYGDDVPSVAKLLLKTTMPVYLKKASVVYDELQKEFWNDIQNSAKIAGELLSIDLAQHQLRCANKVFEFDKIVSTIPLDALFKFCGTNHNLKSRSVCYYLVETDKVNLEGAEQCFVSDIDIDFFKVNKVGNNKYLFYTFEPIEDAFIYFGKFLGYNIDILDARKIDNVIPLGEPPGLDYLVKYGVNCIGSNAQWDDFVDISTSIMRLLRLR